MDGATRGNLQKPHRTAIALGQHIQKKALGGIKMVHSSYLDPWTLDERVEKLSFRGLDAVIPKLSLSRSFPLFEVARIVIFVSEELMCVCVCVCVCVRV
jgi:hypothetical protein